MRLIDLCPREDRAARHCMIKRARTGRHSAGIWRHRKKDGTLILTETSVKTIMFQGQSAKLVRIHDVTEREKQKQAHQEIEERFRQIAENIHEVIWMTDVEKNQLLYISPGYERVWGRTCKSLYESTRFWMESIHPEDAARVSTAVMTKQVRGDYDETYRIVRPDGAVRWVRDRAFPVRDEAGVVRRVVGLAEDITDRRSLEQQFLRAQRMESIGTLASGVAHELNNILAPILMAAPILHGDLSAEERERFLTTIETSARRGSEIVSQVLTFARGTTGERLLMDAVHLLKEMASIAQQTFPKTITIREHYPKSVWPIKGDPTQLHQVLLNLCLNARDAMPKGGEIILSVNNQIVDGPFAAMTPGAKPGPCVILQVSDTGQGIPPSIIDKIFDPFFTTKAVGSGTGLGLSTLIGIVKNHGGWVNVYSEFGRGTTFKVFLPAIINPQASDAQFEGEAPHGQRELLVIVDDERAIVDVTGSILEKHGYSVAKAADGAEALAIFARRMDEVKAVVTDIMMPIMDGISLIRTLRKMKPELPIIASTGWGEDQRLRELKALHVPTCLTKPYNALKLLIALRDSLATAKESIRS